MLLLVLQAAGSALHLTLLLVASCWFFLLVDGYKRKENSVLLLPLEVMTVTPLTAAAADC